MNKIKQIAQDLEVCNDPLENRTLLAKMIYEASVLLAAHESTDSTIANSGPLGLGNLKYSLQTKKKDDGAAMAGLAAMLVILASDASSNLQLREMFMSDASSLVQKIQSSYGIQTGMMSAKLQTVLRSSSRLSEMQGELERASVQAAEAAEQIPILSQSLEDAKRQLTKYHAENNQLILEHARVQDQLNDLEQQVSSFESDRQKILDLQAKVAQYKAEVAGNEIKARELEAEILELKNLEGQLADTVKARAAATKQLVELTSRMDDNIAKKIQSIWELLPKDQLDLMLK